MYWPRRLGELIRAQKETVGLATGGDAMKARSRPGTEVRPTLAEYGIDKKALVILAESCGQWNEIFCRSFKAKIVSSVAANSRRSIR